MLVRVLRLIHIVIDELVSAFGSVLTGLARLCHAVLVGMRCILATVSRAIYTIATFLDLINLSAREARKCRVDDFLMNPGWPLSIVINHCEWVVISIRV